MTTAGLVTLIALVAIMIAGTIWVNVSPNAKFVEERTDEAQLLEAWLDEKQAREPVWDRECRRESCIAALGRGVSVDILRDVYPDVIDEALSEIGKGHG